MVKEEINNLHDWIDQIWRRNCFLKRVIERKIEGKVEGTGIRGRRLKQLVDGLKENRRCKLKDETLNLTLERNRFGRGYRPLVRHYVMIITKVTTPKDASPEVAQSCAGPETAGLRFESTVRCVIYWVNVGTLRLDYVHA